MTTYQCSGLIARVAVVVLLLSSCPAGAQVGGGGGTPPQPGDLFNGLVTGVQYDIVNKAKAEHRLDYLQAKLRRDAERGDAAAVDRGVRRIERDKYRIAVDVWLIRKNSLCDPGYYPVRTDDVSCAAIAQVASPPQYFFAPPPAPAPGPMATAPTLPITIVNAEPAGAVVDFAIDGVAHQAAGGSRQDLTVAVDSNLTYNGGGSLGERRYQVTSGLYEFRSTTEGWALYKLPATP